MDHVVFLLHFFLKVYFKISYGENSQNTRFTVSKLLKYASLECSLVRENAGIVCHGHVRDLHVRQTHVGPLFTVLLKTKCFFKQEYSKNHGK